MEFLFLLQRDFTDECVFNEMLEQHHYNTYSSAKHSGDKKTMYLALDARGRPRKVQLPADRPLGKLSGYVRVLTRPAHISPPRSCVRAPIHHAPRHACNNNNKKKKRKCKPNEKPGDSCESFLHSKKKQLSSRPCEGDDCLREQVVIKNVPVHQTRHKRPPKQKKMPGTRHSNTSENVNTSREKKRRPKPLKNRRKASRAVEDVTAPTVIITTVSSWDHDEFTEEGQDSSTQVGEDSTVWDMTTNSGYDKEFFRGASVALEATDLQDI